MTTNPTSTSTQENNNRPILIEKFIRSFEKSEDYKKISSEFVG